MSIIYSYGNVLAEMKGDDWWTAAPREPELIAEDLPKVSAVEIINRSLIAKPSEIPEGWGTMSGVGPALDPDKLAAFQESLKALDWSKAPDPLDELKRRFLGTSFASAETFAFQESIPAAMWRRINTGKPLDPSLWPDT